MNRLREATHRAEALRAAVCMTLVAWILHVSVRPWHFELDATEILRRLTDGAVALSASPVSHAALFCVLGALLALRRSRRCSDAIAHGAAVAIAVELAQVFAIDRHGRFLDLLLDVTAVAIAVALVHRRRRSLRRVLVGGHEAIARCTLVSAAALAMLALGEGFRGTSLADFDPRFPITVGRETDGTRAFAGVVDDVVLLPVALDPATIARGVLARRPERLDLRDGPGATARLVAADAFTFDFRCQPEGAVRWGPAHLVTCSETAWRRNWTVAQRGCALELWVRCGCTGWNGTQHVLRWEDVFVASTSRRITLSWDHARARLFVDGVPRGGERVLLTAARDDRIAAGAPQGLLGVLLLGPLGALAASLRRRRSRWMVVLLALAAATALELVGAATAGVAIRSTALTVGSGVAVFIVARRTARGSRVRVAVAESNAARLGFLPCTSHGTMPRSPWP